MEKAKQAVASFMSHDGKHKTTVDETVRTAVTDEHVRPHQHEVLTTAIDKEVHQDHHHTTVQPIKAKETLPEQHTHNIVPVKHKTFEHGDEKELRSTLDHDAAKFKDSTVTHGTTHSASTAPVVSGEHIHHHVHEHIQPVIQKETIAPKVVHTTVPIHETHHAAAVHHGTSVMPVKTLEEFTSGGRGLTGKGTTKLGDYDGCPEPYSKDLQTERLDADKNMHSHTGGLSSEYSHSNSGSSNTGLHDSKHVNKTVPRAQVGSDVDGHGTNGSTTSTGSHATKPTLMNKLNPFKDADGDGKKGIMT